MEGAGARGDEVAGLDLPEMGGEGYPNDWGTIPEVVPARPSRKVAMAGVGQDA